MCDSRSEPEIDSLRGRDVDIGAYEENPVGRESDDVVERPFPHVDHLQHLSRARPEHARLLYDEQLLFLRRPQKSPRGGERVSRGDGAPPDGRHGLDGVHDRFSLRGVFLGSQTSVLVGDEVQKVPLGSPCGGEERTTCSGNAATDPERRSRWRRC